jgi:hypothetical protein
LLIFKTLVANHFFTYTYIAIDERLVAPSSIPIDIAKVEVIGPQQVAVWKDSAKGFFQMRGMFIAYDGHTYGSIDITEEILIGWMAQCNCGGGPDSSRIHSYQFSEQFN